MGSKLRADSPSTGVKIARRFTAVGITCFELLALYEFGLRRALAGSEFAWGLGVVFVCFGILKAALLPLAHRLAVERSWVKAVGAAIMWAALTGCAIVVCASRDVGQRSATIGSHGKAQAVLNERLRERDKVEKRLAEIKETRSLAVVEGQIAALRGTYRWGGSKGCTRVVGGEFRKHCDSVAELEAARGPAADADEQRAKLSDLQPKIAEAAKAVPAADLSGEAKLFAWILQTDPATISSSYWWSIVFAVLVAVGPDAALWFVSVARRKAARQGELRWKPEVDPAQQRMPVAQPDHALDLAQERAQGVTRTVAHRHRVTSPKPSAGGPSLGCPSVAQPAVAHAVTQVAQGMVATSAPNVSDAEAAHALGQFVGMLEHGQGKRARSGELLAAYVRLRQANGWPVVDRTTFGRHVRASVEEAGGSKIKSGGQVYVGVAIPATWRLRVVANASQAEGA